MSYWHRFTSWLKSGWNKVANWFEGTGIGSRLTNAINWIANQVQIAPFATLAVASMGVMCLSVFVSPMVGVIGLCFLLAGVILFSEPTILGGIGRIIYTAFTAYFVLGLLILLGVVSDPTTITMEMTAAGLVATPVGVVLLAIFMTGVMIGLFGAMSKNWNLRLLKERATHFLETTPADDPKRAEVQRLSGMLPAHA